MRHHQIKDELVRIITLVGIIYHNRQSAIRNANLEPGT
jgi:hypothetical protein